jgi:chaperone BCS1
MNSLLTLAVASGVGLFLWKQFGNILQFALNFFVTSFEVHSSEVSYSYYLDFLDKHRSRTALRNFKFSHITRMRDKEREGEWYNGLGFGWHLVSYNGKRLLVHHIKNESTMMSYWEVATLVIYYLGDNNMIDEITEELFKQSSGKLETKFYIHNGGWSYLNSRSKRDINSIFWNDKNKDDILQDLDIFLDSKEKYLSLGIPYKRSYLLYGPPGTGKTSMVHALASKYNLNVSLLNISTIQNDNDLITAFASTPKRSILLLEDIDLIFQKLSKGKEHEKNNITFSGILNALDGITYQEGLITFMTTNHYERLDKAVLRDGRMDRKILVDNLTRTTALEMAKSFGKTEKEAKQLFKGKRFPMNPAKIQNLLQYS